MGYFAVIDTETNWADQVMSIGVVVAHSVTMEPLEAKYYILPREAEIGGMYYEALFLKTPVKPIVCTRKKALAELTAWLKSYAVTDIYAYNANFDRNHLPELKQMIWHDIMRLAAYRQTNPAIPADAELCSTGRLKRGYGVEPMLRLLSGERGYHETHNAVHDALDELKIMKLMGHPLENYIAL